LIVILVINLIPIFGLYLYVEILDSNDFQDLNINELVKTKDDVYYNQDYHPFIVDW